MANTAQARKRARQSANQRVHNVDQRSSLRTAIKKVRKAIATGDKASAQTVFIASQKVIDSIADKKIIHKNLAARQKSRLSAAIKALWFLLNCFLKKLHLLVEGAAFFIYIFRLILNVVYFYAQLP